MKPILKLTLLSVKIYYTVSESDNQMVLMIKIMTDTFAQISLLAQISFIVMKSAMAY